jgi:hypothetical protein
MFLQISKPRIGDVFPSEVRAIVEIDLGRFQGDIRAEWESLKERDGSIFLKARIDHFNERYFLVVVFFLCIQNPLLDISNQINEFNFPMING